MDGLRATIPAGKAHRNSLGATLLLPSLTPSSSACSWPRRALPRAGPVSPASSCSVFLSALLFLRHRCGMSPAPCPALSQWVHGGCAWWVKAQSLTQTSFSRYYPCLLPVVSEPCGNAVLYRYPGLASQPVQ